MGFALAFYFNTMLAKKILENQVLRPNDDQMRQSNVMAPSPIQWRYLQLFKLRGGDIEELT